MPLWNTDCPVQNHHLYAPLQICFLSIRRHEEYYVADNRGENQPPRAILEEPVQRRYAWVISGHLFHMLESASLTLGSGTPQQRASFARCSSQTPHVTSPQSRHLPTRDLRVSWHQQNTTGLRENFDPRACWRNAIIAARVLSQFGNHKGASNHKDKPIGQL